MKRHRITTNPERAPIAPRNRHNRDVMATRERIIRPVYAAPRKDGDWR